MQIDQSVWNQLSKPSGEELIARNPFPDKIICLFCALDKKGHRHILIPLKETDNEYNDTKSKGFIAITRALSIHGSTCKKYLDIECIDVNGYSIFNLVGSEIFDKINNTTQPVVEEVKRVIFKWRRFWGNFPQNLLSREEQIGLFAELWFLSVWLIPKIGPSGVLAWSGPCGSKNDFELTNLSIEVKATMNSRGRIHKISNLYQLENPENGPLYLFSMCLSEDSTSLNNLTSLIDNCFNQISDSPELLDFFESSLYKAGYSPVYRDVYSEMKIHLIEENLFIVKDDFPRIINSCFLPRISTGVEHIEYIINLNSFNHLIICNNPKKLDIF